MKTRFKIVLAIMIVLPLIIIIFEDIWYLVLLFDFLGLIFLMTRNKKLNFSMESIFNDKFFAGLGIFFVVTALIIIGISLYYLKIQNHLNINSEGIGFEKIYWLGTFFGGTIGPLLTFSTVCFLAANYHHNKSELIRKEADNIIQEWYNFIMDITNKLSVKNFNIRFYDIKGKIKVFPTIESVNEVLLSYCDRLSKEKLNGLEIKETISVLFHIFGTFCYFLYEIDNCPKGEEKTLENYKNRLLNHHYVVMPDCYRSFSVIYVLLSICILDQEIGKLDLLYKYIPLEVLDNQASALGIYDKWKTYKENIITEEFFKKSDG